jgi:neurofibromin 1
MEMTYAILVFLDASPLSLFIGSPKFSAPEWLIFFEDIFTAFASYLVIDDERTRYLTNIVARKILTDGTRSLYRKSQKLGSRTFKYNFWKTTSVLSFLIYVAAFISNQATI